MELIQYILRLSNEKDVFKVEKITSEYFNNRIRLMSQPTAVWSNSEKREFGPPKVHSPVSIVSIFRPKY